MSVAFGAGPVLRVALGPQRPSGGPFRGLTLEYCDGQKRKIRRVLNPVNLRKMKTEVTRVKGFRRLIPSMTAVVEFEAAARLSSFTVAASELGVTQAAVSRQIRALEDSLHIRLFDRLHRSVKLTEEGLALYQTVSAALQRIAGALDALATESDDEELVLAATAAFSQFRILPRLRQLRGLMPELQLRLTTLMFTSDLRHKEVDLAVRYGDGNWKDGTSIRLFDEEVFPVCAPDWLATNGHPEDLDELARATLIDCEATSEGWMIWEEWFRGMGSPRRKFKFGLRCTLYTDAVQAARQGEGVLLGWSRLVDQYITSGELVRLGSLSLKMSDSYFAVVPHGRSLGPTTQVLIDWLRDDALSKP